MVKAMCVEDDPVISELTHEMEQKGQTEIGRALIVAS